MKNNDIDQSPNVFKLWEQITTPYPRIYVDRTWQVRAPVKDPVIAAKTIPLFGVNPIQGRSNLSDRNLRRITSKGSKPEKFVRKIRNYK